MAEHHPLIATIVYGLVLAFLLGALANRLRISPLVGYLLAGVVVGPFTPGFVADQRLAPELAELGVILLMFGVGMHFSIKDLMSVKAIAIPGAIGQILVATVMGWGLGAVIGWPPIAGIVFGLALSVASTVVLLRAMQERRLLETERGKIAVGWLIVEDLVMVMALVLLPPIAAYLNQVPAADGAAATSASRDILIAGAITIGKVIAFIALMLVVGKRLIPRLLHYVAHTGSRELFRLSVLAIALGIAYGSVELFGVSFALGAFFAGVVLGESELSQRAAEESLPLRDAFAVLFFVSVGMLFDPGVLVRDPWLVLATLVVILLGKSLGALLIVLAFRHPLSTALTISASLAQIGEFSFILAGLAVTLDLIPERGRDLILVGAILSILANPLFFAGLDRLRPWLERREAASAAPGVVEPTVEELPETALGGHDVVVGFGRVGRIVAERLRRENHPLLVIEERREAAEQARAQGFETLYANAVNSQVAKAAGVARARRLFVAIPEAFEAGQIILQARAANAAVEIIARAHFDAEVDHLRDNGANVIIMGEREIAQAMIDHALGIARSERI
jgi:CPA2 family monovalent cation:H+ antiporter-2